MALSLATADAALKDDYQDMIREQLNQANFLLSQIETNTKDVEGRQAILSLHVSRNSGVGARAESGVLPTAGSQGYVQERVGLRYNYGRIQLSGPVLKAMKSDKGSFTRALDSEVKGITSDLKRDVNRQLYGTSNGVVATCGVTTASTTVVLAASTPASALRQLQDIGVVDIGTVGTPTSIATNRIISAVDFAARTITISGAAVTTTGAAFVFRTGSGGVGLELTGLQTIVAATGTLFNVDPTVNAIWKSTVRATVGSISDTVLESVMDEVNTNTGDDIDVFITTSGVSRAYAASLTSQKRFSNTIDLKGGFSALAVNAGRGDVGLKWDRDCPDGMAFGLDTDHLFQHQSSDWEFMDEDGAILSRVPNTDAYEATLFKYHELTTDQRNSHAVLSGIAEA